MLGSVCFLRDANPDIDYDKQNEVEKEVSKVIREKFTFCVIPIEDKEKRLRLESKMISTISHCFCKPSKKWLGMKSPKEKIRRSGLWLVNELWKTPLSDKEVEELINIIKV
ncbi:MAG: hypothetical protein ACE5FT_03935 [Candidatus Nanoarchaeia archaeon]